MIKSHVLRSLLGYAIGFLLYRSFVISFLVAILFTVVSFLDRKRERKKKNKIMTLCFRDFLISLEPILKSSETFGIAYAKAIEDYEKMHGTDVLIPILRTGLARFRINEKTDKIMSQIAKKADIEDAYLFAGSIKNSEETGISIIDITNQVIGIITQKIQLMMEIDGILAVKKFEHILVSLIPAIILLFLSVGADSYMAPLYQTLSGRIVMTTAGLIFGISWYTGKKITSIEV